MMDEILVLNRNIHNISILRNRSYLAYRWKHTTQPGTSGTWEILRRHLWSKHSTTSQTCLRVQKQIAPSIKY